MKAIIILLLTCFLTVETSSQICIVCRDQPPPSFSIRAVGCIPNYTGGCGGLDAICDSTFGPSNYSSQSYCATPADCSGLPPTECPYILPVELSAFNLRIIEDYVKLEWETLSELNNLGFEIKRGSNANEWQTIGFVEGNGTSLETHYYFFEDKTPVDGINYYRLRQVDLDGNHQFSEIVSINFEKLVSTTLIYPNPSTGIFKIKYSANKQDKQIERLAIISPEGKLIDEHINIPIQSEISIETLSPGIYVVKMQWKSGQRDILRLIVE